MEALITGFLTPPPKKVYDKMVTAPYSSRLLNNSKNQYFSNYSTK